MYIIWIMSTFLPLEDQLDPMEDENPLSGSVIDEMLWNLGRYLKIAGFSVITPRPTNDRELALISKRMDHILVTRDKGLSNLRDARTILINSDRTPQQLSEPS